MKKVIGISMGFVIIQIGLFLLYGFFSYSYNNIVDEEIEENPIIKILSYKIGEY